MIVVFNLKTGEDLIGSVDGTVCDVENFDKHNYIKIYNPMYIVRSMEGMKLVDCLLLSNDETIIIRSRDIIMCYEPFTVLEKYYQKVITFTETITKPQTKQQISQAFSEIEQTIDGDKKTQSALTQTLLKISKNTLQ